MPGKSSLVIRAEVSDGLEVHVAAFLATLPALGYAEKTQHDKRRGLAPFIRWMRDSRIAIAALNETYVARFIARRRFYRKHRAPAALRQFLEYLRVVGIVPRRCVEDSGGEVLVRNYLDHLRDGQGLCQRSLEIYGPYVRSFVAVLRLPARIGSLDALSVRGYLLEQSGIGPSPTSSSSERLCVRSYAFAFSKA